MTTLNRASAEWSNRPKDQRFASLEELDAYCKAGRVSAKTADVPLGSLRVEAADSELSLVGKVGIPATFTNWSFGQLCQRVGAPAGYLRKHAPTMAAQELNHDLANMEAEDVYSKLYFHNGNGLRLHAITSDRYTRIWDADITEKLLNLSREHPQWQPAPAAFDGSRGLYASDHDLFAFLVDNNRRIFEKDPNGGLSRGFFCWNSEVGATSFGVMTFLYEFVCGNHMIWGAKGMEEIRIRHVGTADERAFRELAIELRKYSDASISDVEAQIGKAKQYRIAATKEEVLDAIFQKRIPSLTISTVENAYTAAEAHEAWYGDPKTAWGMANGITEIAQLQDFTDSRVALERAAGKVIEMAF